VLPWSKMKRIQIRKMRSSKVLKSLKMMDLLSVLGSLVILTVFATSNANPEAGESEVEALKP